MFRRKGTPKVRVAKGLDKGSRRPVSRSLLKSAKKWPTYVGKAPDGTGETVLRCSECHLRLLKGDRDWIAGHMVQSHGYSIYGNGDI